MTDEPEAAELSLGARARRIDAVLLRELWLGGRSPNAKEASDAVYGASERHAALTALFSRIRAPVINRPSRGSVERRTYRPPDLHVASQATPFTMQRALLTSDVDPAIAFVVARGQSGVLLARADSDRVVGIQGSDVLSQLRSELANGPVMLMERFSAHAVRVFVVGDVSVAERCPFVWDPTVSAAQRRRHQYHSLELNAIEAAACQEIVRRLRLSFGVLFLAQSAASKQLTLCGASALPDIGRASPKIITQIVDCLGQSLLGARW
jgi:hypothetical protein